MFDKLKEFLDSPEGQKSIDDQVEEWNKEDLQHKRNYDRFYRLIEKNGLDTMINKINDHYGSDKYIDREYKLGYQPRECLKNELFTYFEKFGEETDQKDWGMFTSSEFKIDKWIVGLAIGQGSYIYIKEINERE